MKYYVVHAFANSIFGGNPAAVVLLSHNENSVESDISNNTKKNLSGEFPSDDLMIKIAAEFRYSETAFVKQISEKEFNIRYFTPTAEVELCGHATIASFYVLLKEGIIDNNSTCINHTLSETIEVTVQDGNVMMDMASPRVIDIIENKAELTDLYNIMGIEYRPKFYIDPTGKPIELLPTIVSTGLPDVILPVDNIEELNKINPDMNALSELSEKYSVTGVHAFAINTNSNDTSSSSHISFNSDNVATKLCCDARNFAPLFGIDEEAATGTANGALTYYLYKNNIIASDAACKILQGEAMDRPSIIMSYISTHKIDTDKSVSIKIGGTAAIYAKGDLLLHN